MMKRFRRFVKLESGQSIVIVALAMVAMLALAGLAIDGGNLFLQRRRAQNAADAGSLGGTRVLAETLAKCAYSEPEKTDGLVYEMVEDMIESNGFLVSDGSKWTAYYVDKSSTRKGTVGAGTIPNGVTGVEVDLGAVFPTNFMKVVGIANGSVSVDATAMTGRLMYAEGGLMPIGVPLKVAKVLGKGDKWATFDDSEHFCLLQSDGDCDEIGVSDPNSQRGWLNLNYIYNQVQDKSMDDLLLNRTCTEKVGTNICNNPPPGLRGYASGLCTYPEAIWPGNPPDSVDADGNYSGWHLDGDFIHGEPGSASSGSQAVYDHFDLGEVLFTPIFDRIYDPNNDDEWNDDTPGEVDYMEPPAASTELQWGCNLGGNNWPGAGSYLYHIVGFAAFKLEDPDTFGEKINNPKGVYGEFLEPYIGPGLIDPRDGYGQECLDYLVYGVNLWE